MTQVVTWNSLPTRTCIESHCFIAGSWKFPWVLGSFELSWLYIKVKTCYTAGFSTLSGGRWAITNSDSSALSDMLFQANGQSIWTSVLIWLYKSTDSTFFSVLIFICFCVPSCNARCFSLGDNFCLVPWLQALDWTLVGVLTDSRQGKSRKLLLQTPAF